MLRLPAVAGRFYPSDPKELTSLVQKYSQRDSEQETLPVKACLVPHAG
jgi:AmmeMemoRadiSam system protein B